MAWFNWKIFIFSFPTAIFGAFDGKFISYLSVYAIFYDSLDNSQAYCSTTIDQFHIFVAKESLENEKKSFYNKLYSLFCLWNCRRFPIWLQIHSLFYTLGWMDIAKRKDIQKSSNFGLNITLRLQRNTIKTQFNYGIYVKCKSNDK